MRKVIESLVAWMGVPFISSLLLYPYPFSEKIGKVEYFFALVPIALFLSLVEWFITRFKVNPDFYPVIKRIMKWFVFF